MKELPELVRNNPDVTFIQIFVEGSRNKTESNDEGEKESTIDTIRSFYEASDASIDPAQEKDWLILQKNEDIKKEHSCRAISPRMCSVFLLFPYLFQGHIDTDIGIQHIHDQKNSLSC